MMKITIALAALAVSEIAAKRLDKSNPHHKVPMTTRLIQKEFNDYCSKFGKHYSSKKEYNMRIENFKKAKQFIKLENAKGHSYTLGLTKFSDWTREEIDKLSGASGNDKFSGEKLRSMTDQHENKGLHSKNGGLVAFALQYGSRWTEI